MTDSFEVRATSVEMGPLESLKKRLIERINDALFDEE